MLHPLDQHFSKIPLAELKPAMLLAREKTIDCANKIIEKLELGINEVEAKKIALEIFAKHGSLKHWHQPFIRFNSGTLLGFKDQPQEDNILKDNSVITMDLGPIWFDENLKLLIEADYGLTKVHGKNEDVNALINFGDELFLKAKQLWLSKKVNGIELYTFIEKSCQDSGYFFSDDFTGHPLSELPHQQYSRADLNTFEYYPQECLWVLELKILSKDRTFAYFFEDILF